MNEKITRMNQRGVTPLKLVEEEPRKTRKRPFRPSLQFVLIIILITAGIVGLIHADASIRLLDDKVRAAEEASRPAEIKIVSIVDPDCSECTPLNTYMSKLSNQNVRITGEKTLELENVEARNIIEKYGVAKLPFFMVTGELQKHAEVAELLSSWGTITDDVFTLSAVAPPYVDMDTGKTKGLVKLTYLTDETCTECYDVTVNKQILEKNWGLALIEEKSVDISSEDGEQLLEKYSITKVPTFLLSPEASVYAGLSGIWDNVGTKGFDGTYIFTNIQELGTYYDLEKKERVDVVAAGVSAQSNARDESNSVNAGNYHALQPEEFKNLVEREDILLVDVHIPEQTHIDGTDEIIPYTDVDAIEAAIKARGAKEVAVYCRSGGMSREVSDKLVARGYDVYDLRGGRNAWVTAGYE